MGDGKAGRRPLTYDDRLAIERGLNRGDGVSLDSQVHRARSQGGG